MVSIKGVQMGIVKKGGHTQAPTKDVKLWVPRITSQDCEEFSRACSAAAQQYPNNLQ